MDSQHTGLGGGGKKRGSEVPTKIAHCFLLRRRKPFSNKKFEFNPYNIRLDISIHIYQWNVLGIVSFKEDFKRAIKQLYLTAMELELDPHLCPRKEEENPEMGKMRLLEPILFCELESMNCSSQMRHVPSL